MRLAIGIAAGVKRRKNTMMTGRNLSRLTDRLEHCVTTPSANQSTRKPPFDLSYDQCFILACYGERFLLKIKPTKIPPTPKSQHWLEFLHWAVCVSLPSDSQSANQFMARPTYTEQKVTKGKQKPSSRFDRPTIVMKHIWDIGLENICQ